MSDLDEAVSVILGKTLLDQTRVGDVMERNPDTGLLRFREEDPDFEHIMRLWMLGAQGEVDVIYLDWNAMNPRLRRLMTSVAAPWPWVPGRECEGVEERSIVVGDDASDEELVALIRGLASGTIAPDFVDWDAMSETKRNVVWVLSRHEIRRQQRLDRERTKGRPQKRAMRLLMSLLTDNQRWSLRNRRYFFVQGATTGHIYRLWPHTGLAERVTKHGKRWFVHTRLCLHDPQVLLPPADVTVSHLLLLRGDEQRFLDLANATDARSMFWNGEWLRRLNRRRMERAA